MNVFISFISILIGYLLGSINPAYFLAKYLKKVDIREYGDKNAGTTNASHILGKWLSVFIAIFDLSKGVLSMGIAYFIGAPLFFVYLAGIAAIVGHIFPFYLNFRGGQGAATTIGLLLTFLFFIFTDHRMPIVVLFLLIFYTLIIKFIVQENHIMALFNLPLLALWIIYYNYQNIDLLIFFTLLVILFAFCINAFNLITNKTNFIIKPAVKKEFLRWRVFLRPLAIIFPLLYLYFDKKTILIIIGAVALVFLVTDISRLSIKKLNELLFKSAVEIFREKENKKISSMSIFLIACFLTILIFEKPIAITAIFFLIFGDISSKFFGLQFGRTKIFHKTLEGSLGCFLACFSIGLLLSNFIPLSLLIIFLGSIAAAIAEVLPFRIDDNFTVPLISAAVMLVAKLF